MGFLDDLSEAELFNELSRRKDEALSAQKDLKAANGTFIDASAQLAAAKARLQKLQHTGGGTVPTSKSQSVKLEQERAQSGIRDLQQACGDNAVIQKGLIRRCAILVRSSFISIFAHVLFEFLRAGRP